MSSVTEKHASIGFLTVIESNQHGLFGGYLILNTNGRPLEFHCTSPVKANKAQEILYGPTLKPYLYGEQIAAALVQKSGTTPLIICTDCSPVMSVRSMIETPVLHVSLPEVNESIEISTSSDSAADSEKQFFRFDEKEISSSHFMKQNKFHLAEHEVGVCALHPEDRDKIEATWQQHISQFDLAEPFTRIVEAIQEAQ